MEIKLSANNFSLAKYKSCALWIICTISKLELFWWLFYYNIICNLITNGFTILMGCLLFNKDKSFNYLELYNPAMTLVYSRTFSQYHCSEYNCSCNLYLECFNYSWHSFLCEQTCWWSHQGLRLKQATLMLPSTVKGHKWVSSVNFCFQIHNP